MKSYVLVIDSGVGGIGILKECVKLVPNEHFLYVADNKNAPYGNKSKEELTLLSKHLIEDYLTKYNIKLVLLACNTLTATSIMELRRMFELPFVGVEPAVKVAMEKGEKAVLLLSTVATLKYNKNLNALRKQMLSDVYFLPLTDLAKKIDDNLQNLTALQPYVNELLAFYKDKNIHSVVLGCTHYLFVANLIKNALNEENLNFFESSVAVAKRVKFLLEENNITSEEKKGSVLLKTTKKDAHLKQKLALYLN